MYISSLAVAVPALVLSTIVSASTITTFSYRAEYDLAVGATTLENFTDSSHYPIPGGSLSSTSNFGTLSSGDIQVGATYTTPIGTGSYFNIDSGGGFTGGFLDSLKSAGSRALTIYFDTPESAFGFDTNMLMGTDFDITINFSSEPSYIQNFSVKQFILQTEFFGFQSNLSDITSVVIQGNGTGLNGFNFALDNVSYGGVSSVPVPAAVWLFGSGLIGLIGVARRKKA